MSPAILKHFDESATDLPACDASEDSALTQSTLAMPGQPDTHHIELIFVNAPTLNDHPGGADGTPSIRSRLIRQLLKKKKLNSAKRLLLDKPVSDEFLNPAVFESRDSISEEKPSELVPCGVSSPRTMLSAARSDPFSPWNFELKSYGNEVLDFCESAKAPGSLSG